MIDKPAGVTSHDCVKRLRKVFGIKKIGHGGTLDPSVTGVLPIAIGDATRLIGYLQGSKAYEGIIQLGLSTTTDDMQGDVINSKSWPLIDHNNLNNLLDSFRGEISQKPPLFSSVNIKGERAYKKARRGERFETIAKKVTINQFNLLNWSIKKGQFEFFVDCSAGTYIRSLARDIGDQIGCGACLKNLRRTKAFSFNESHSVLLPEALESYLEINKPKLLNPKYFLKHLNSYKLTSEKEIKSWRTGREIAIQSNNQIDRLSNGNEFKDSKVKNIVLMLDQNNQIVGIAERSEDLTLSPKVVFNAIG